MLFYAKWAEGTISNFESDIKNLVPQKPRRAPPTAPLNMPILKLYKTSKALYEERNAPHIKVHLPVNDENTMLVKGFFAPKGAKRFGRHSDRTSYFVFFTADEAGAKAAFKASKQSAALTLQFKPVVTEYFDGSETSRQIGQDRGSASVSMLSTPQRDLEKESNVGALVRKHQAQGTPEQAPTIATAEPSRQEVENSVASELAPSRKRKRSEDTESPVARKPDRDSNFQEPPRMIKLTGLSKGPATAKHEPTARKDSTLGAKPSSAEVSAQRTSDVGPTEQDNPVVRRSVTNVQPEPKEQQSSSNRADDSELIDVADLLSIMEELAPPWNLTTRGERLEHLHSVLEKGAAFTNWRAYSLLHKMDSTPPSSNTIEKPKKAQLPKTQSRSKTLSVSPDFQETLAPSPLPENLFHECEIFSQAKQYVERRRMMRKLKRRLLAA